MTPRVTRSTTRTKQRVHLRIFDDGIRSCDRLSARIVDKYNEFTKIQENLRVNLLSMDKDSEFLKMWFHAAYEGIMELKSESGDFVKLYETLLRNNLVEEFLNYTKDHEELRIKFIESVIEREALKKNLNAGYKFIVTLKARYNNLVRYERKHGNEELLRFTEYIESLRSILVKKIDHYKSLKIRVNKAYKDMVLLKSNHVALMERFKVLSEDKTVKEFINYAKQWKTRFDKEITSSPLELSDTGNMLNEKRSESEKITSFEELDSLSSLSSEKDEQDQSSNNESIDLYSSVADSNSTLDSDFKTGSSISDIKELSFDVEESYEEYLDNFQRLSQLYKNNKKPAAATKNSNEVPISTSENSLKLINFTDRSNTSNVHCHICNRNYSTNAYLKRHMQNIHYAPN